MDFLSYVGSEISDGVDWLFKNVSAKDLFNTASNAANLFGGKTQAQSQKISQSLLTPPMARETSTREGPGIRTTRVASARPAQVHTEPLFQEKNSDPWMYTFRSVLNRTTIQDMGNNY